MRRLSFDPSGAADRESWRRLVRVCVGPVLAWNVTLNDSLIDRYATTREAEVPDSKLLLLEDGTRLKIIGEFCHLDNMIGAAGCAEDASKTRVRCG